MGGGLKEVGSIDRIEASSTMPTVSGLSLWGRYI